MSYHPPTHILEVIQKIDFEEALEPDDPRFVQTERARGAERTQKLLASKLGLSLSDGSFFPNSQKHVLFFGHTGSGKTTELKRYQRTLSGGQRFYVVEVDITNELDRNNLEYSDVLMAMARRLIQCLQQDFVLIDEAAVGALKAWFVERVQTEDRSQEFAAALQTGAKAKAGLPFLGELLSVFHHRVSLQRDLQKVDADGGAEHLYPVRRGIQPFSEGSRKGVERLRAWP